MNYVYLENIKDLHAYKFDQNWECMFVEGLYEEKSGYVLVEESRFIHIDDSLIKSSTRNFYNVMYQSENEKLTFCCPNNLQYKYDNLKDFLYFKESIEKSPLNDPLSFFGKINGVIGAAEQAINYTLVSFIQNNVSLRVHGLGDYNKDEKFKTKVNRYAESFYKLSYLKGLYSSLNSATSKTFFGNQFILEPEQISLNFNDKIGKENINHFSLVVEFIRKNPDIKINTLASLIAYAVSDESSRRKVRRGVEEFLNKRGITPSNTDEVLRFIKKFVF